MSLNHRELEDLVNYQRLEISRLNMQLEDAKMRSTQAKASSSVTLETLDGLIAPAPGWVRDLMWKHNFKEPGISVLKSICHQGIEEIISDGSRMPSVTVRCYKLVMRTSDYRFHYKEIHP